MLHITLKLIKNLDWKKSEKTFTFRWKTSRKSEFTVHLF